MEKSNKELAVELACAALNSMSSRQGALVRPLTGDDIEQILNDCYFAICSLDEPNGI